LASMTVLKWGEFDWSFDMLNDEVGHVRASRCRILQLILTIIFVYYPEDATDVVDKIPMDLLVSQESILNDWMIK